MEKVSVVLADWQVLFREGIHFTLSGEEDIEVIGEVTNSGEALNFIEANPPRVAILNADRGEPSGIDVTGRIKQNLPCRLVELMEQRAPEVEEIKPEVEEIKFPPGCIRSRRRPAEEEKILRAG